MLSIKSHLLTPNVKDNLVAVSRCFLCFMEYFVREKIQLSFEYFKCQEMKHGIIFLQAASIGQSGRKVSFPYFMAFSSLLNNMELIKRIYLNATNGHRYEEVTKGM